MRHVVVRSQTAVLSAAQQCTSVSIVCMYAGAVHAVWWCIWPANAVSAALLGLGWKSLRGAVLLAGTV